MTNRDFIVGPQTTTAEVVANPYLEALNVITLAPGADKFSGLPERMTMLVASLPTDLKEENLILVEGFWDAINPTRLHASFEDFLEEVQQRDAEAMQQKALEGLYHMVKKHSAKEGREIPDLPDPADLLSDETVYNDCLSLFDQEEHISRERRQQMYHLLTHPEELKSVLLNHMQAMWHDYLHDAVKATRPITSATVEAFRHIDLSEYSPMEAARVVTGRDLSGTFLAEMIENAAQLYFIPSGFMGPYVSAFKLENGDVTVLFGARMPDGVKATSPELTRSELLVRLNALADDTRLRILEVLIDGSELCAQDFITRLGLSQSAASRHLRQLSATGYLSERTRQGAKCYHLNRDRVQDTLQALQNFLLETT
jgi:DNA-binding transcriptional ArsR family regulator